jgi:amidohydrolase
LGEGKPDMDIRELKKSVVKDIDASYPGLRELSQKLHDHPETALAEHQASAWLGEFLKRNGFKVESGICELPTAFRGSYGKGSPIIAFLAEYDALPKIGHACGHNLIAAASVAAGVACRQAVDRLGGSIMVFGTPAEELHGGKAMMAERGAFTDVDAAMLVHPGGGGNRVAMSTLACATLEVEFFGRAAHAAERPEEGINALEAMILSFNAINSLRPHIGAGALVNGIITDGGEAANIIPAHTAATFIVRAASDSALEELQPKVISCFTGAAAATGAKLEYRWGESYAAMVSNMTLARLFKENLQSLGHDIRLGGNDLMSFSTDVGNVSRLVPTIQPMVSVAPDAVLIHTPEFAKVAATEDALHRMLDAAKAMAMTAIDLLDSPETMEKVQAEFRKGRS